MDYNLKTAEGKTMKELECMEILEQVAKRKLNVLMVFSEISDIFNLLNLRGYKRKYEYKKLKEEKEYLHIKKWVIEKYGAIPNVSFQIKKEINPFKVATVGRRDKILKETKQKIIAEIFKELVSFLEETLKLYEEAFSALSEKGCISDSITIGKFIKRIEDHIKKTKREIVKLNDVDYSLEFIYEFQKSMHDRYKDKMREIDMCTD